jgi:uncharacterized delta-60 repeat protein
MRFTPSALQRILVIASLTGASVAQAADGDLDLSFGNAGKVQIASSSLGRGTSLVVADVAFQSNGKIVAVGNDDQNDCFVFRLNLNGTLDTTFGGLNGFPAGFVGYAGCDAASIAVRPDDRIVALVNNNANLAAFVMQFSAAGVPDPAFTNENSAGIVQIQAASGDTIHGARIVVDSDGTVDIAGTYDDLQNAFNSNQFFFDRVAADGSSNEPFRYNFGSGANQDDHAFDLAIDTQGRYVVAGYHRGASGNYDCAAIRIARDLNDVDHSFGSGGQTTVAYDGGGDNGDFCNAIAIFPSSGYMALGGHATVTAGTGTYQAAVLFMLDDVGNLFQYEASGIGYPAKFAFSYNLHPAEGLSNDIVKLIIDDSDTKFPQLLAIGTGFQSGPPYGQMFGIARFNLPSHTNFAFDTALNGKGVEGIYFAERPSGFGALTTTNTGLSAALNQNRLVVVGSTQAPGGNDIAITRLAAFDAIFSNGFDTPSY